MDLNTKESLIFSEGASFIPKYLAIGGMLILSNDSLRFSPHNQKDSICTLNLSLEEISQVNFFRTLQVVPNGLEIIMNNGTSRRFVVDDRNIWKNRIICKLESSELVG